MKNLALTLLLALGILGAASAQDPGSGGPQPGNPTPDPTEIPLDGGAALLALGGGAYLLSTLRRRR